jgi:hypothetical protein
MSLEPEISEELREKPQARERMGGIGAVLGEQLERANKAAETARSVILVEGVSDQRAVEALARRQLRDLERDGVVVIPIAGATNIGRFVDLLGPAGHDLRLAGLCDEREELQFRIALERAGLGSGLARDDLAQLGFFVCIRDLEEELIRALGADTVLSIMESQLHLRRFRSFQNQPAQSHKSIEEQIWRWLGNHKIRYAPLMVDALPLDRVPRPLEGVLAQV